jgi:hypothetical protein
MRYYTNKYSELHQSVLRESKIMAQHEF